MRVPSLHLLRAFSEAARLGSFSRAAASLNVTQSAVSQQIRQLEQEVGTDLFQREGRRIMLTDFGRVYLRLVSGPIAALEEGHTTLRAMTGRSSIVLHLSRSFGSQWMAPRLADFGRRHPDISVTGMFLNPGDNPTSNSGDAYITSTRRPDEQAEFILEPLFATTLCPVAASSLGPVDVSRLDDYPIIHTLRRHDDWRTWCMIADVPVVSRDKGWSFESSSMSYSAALNGLGIVMAELEFVAEDLKHGRLQQVSPITAPSGHHFHIAYTRGRYARPALRKFREWLQGQL
ncbi:LysR substrate-binding domain-containing protein [Devosia ginsengisoli]|uniref:LysR substrate-binding domain-containing protein n=1 Tax=Devosia ginsengisoli TaxID=400770 RepID=UPI0026EBD92D|nr:LysR substrate-binding domain-containing protein [Devosia ginsengisoli]MCR6671987.1 LysR substrate-binding domain-containing protein [Devosia ginsengisoli]